MPGAKSNIPAGLRLDKKYRDIYQVKANKERNKKRLQDPREYAKLVEHNKWRAQHSWEILDEVGKKERVKKASDWARETGSERRVNANKKISEMKRKNHPTKGKTTSKKVKNTISNSLTGVKRYRYPKYVLQDDNGNHFKSCGDAAKFYKVKPDTISKWVRQSGIMGMKWVNNYIDKRGKLL